MNKFFKQTIGILMGIFLLGSVFAAVQQWNNSKLDISQKRILFTDTGLPGGNCIMDINSGGNIIACTGIQDTLGNVYITGGALSGYLTGYTETDPIWNATSGDYVLMSVTGDWNTAYSRVNTESGNALFFRNNSGDYVLMSMTGNWNTAYGRGDHSGLYVTLANSGDYYTLNPLGYITGYTETDPIYMANSGLYYLATNPSGYIDDSALNRQYAGGLLTPVHTGTIKFHVGQGGSANGTDSISMGYNTTSQGNNSVAIGNQTQAIGYSSVAMGMGTTASGNYSFAVGYDTITNGVYSNAFGIGTITNANSCTSIGKYNIGLTNSIFEVGIGLSGGARYNALTITNTGVIKLDQLTGYACLATDVNGAIYDNSSSFVGWVNIDTGFNNTGSDVIIPSEKTVYSLVSNMTSGYLPYRNGITYMNSPFHLGTFSDGAYNLYNIQATGHLLINSSGINVAGLSVMSNFYGAKFFGSTIGIGVESPKTSAIFYQGYPTENTDDEGVRIQRSNDDGTYTYGGPLLRINDQPGLAINTGDLVEVTTGLTYQNKLFTIGYDGLTYIARSLNIGTTLGLTYKLNVKSDIGTIYGIYSESLNYPGYFVQTGGGTSNVGVKSQAAIPFYSQINNDDERNSYNLFNRSATTGGWSIFHSTPTTIGLNPYGIRRGGAYMAASSADTIYKGGFYINSGINVATTPSGSRRIVMSGENLSIQVLSGATWLEKATFTP